MPQYTTKRGYKVTTGKYRQAAAKPRAAIARSRRGRRTIAARTSYLGAAGDAKYIDLASAVYNFDTTGDIVHLDVVPQGTSVNERDGRAWKDTSLSIRGSAVNDSTATYTNNALIIVWDKQPNKALPAITDILDSANVVSLNKRENSSRFVTVRRFQFILTGKGDGSTTDGFAKTFDEYIRLPKGCIATTTSGDTTGAIANRISGALYAISVGSVVAGTTACAGTFTMRLNFMDV